MVQKSIPIILLIALLSASNCKQSKEGQTTSPTKETTILSPDFEAFYERFGKDSVFQLEHITFPLEGITSPTDTTVVIDDSFRWQREDWKIHKPFDDMDGTYLQDFLTSSGIVVEKISDESGTFTMERRFAKIGGEWHLIYYRSMGMY